MAGATTCMSIQEQRKLLAIYKDKERLVQKISENQVLTVMGDTGVGKTTQIPQYLVEAGFQKIVCAQPRRVVTVETAKRVAKEFGCEIGQEIGYAVRFEECFTSDTRIKYMTDGMLLRQCLHDPDLSEYSVILLDDAHERTVNTDVILSLVKKIMKKRPELKLIVTSASLDVVKLSEFFSDAPILTINEAKFPVEIVHEEQSPKDHVEAAILTVIRIHMSEPEGDILVFLSCQEEIERACETLEKRVKALGTESSELIVIPMYLALPEALKVRVFQKSPAGARRVIVSTRISEASMTIDNINYVVDSGLIKQKYYKNGVHGAVSRPISQMQANQRGNLAGRGNFGKCYRLYTEDFYCTEMLPDSTVPEIQRTNLKHAILILKAFGIENVFTFEFIDHPVPKSLKSGVSKLQALGALDADGHITTVGSQMVEFPVDPNLSKTLILSADLDCSEEVLTIVAMITAQTIFEIPESHEEEARRKLSTFHDARGDHFTLLAIFNSWKSQKFSESWCEEFFLSLHGMKRAKNIREKLLKMFGDMDLKVSSCADSTEQAVKAFCGGFIHHAAKRVEGEDTYKTVDEHLPSVYIDSFSVLHSSKPEWVIYDGLVYSEKKYYMHHVLAVEKTVLDEFNERE